MGSANPRLAFFEAWPDPVGERLVRERSEIELVRLELAAPEVETWRLLRSAQAYHLSSLRQELPARYRVNRELCERCPELLIVSTYGAGYDTVDVATCTEAGIVVVNQAGGNREAVAEHALAMMLCLSKRLVEADRRLRRGRDFHRDLFIGHDLFGKTLGVVGLGTIGTRLAELCGTLFGMPVLAFDPLLTAGQIRRRGAEPAGLERLLAESDFVSIHCPRSAETLGLIGSRELALMRPGAYLVTTARGGIVDELALADALLAGRLAGAGLDVWDDEPPPPDHPLLALDNVVATPHTAGVTHEARYNLAVAGAEQLIALFAGQRPPRLVNPEAWPRYAERFEQTFGRPVRA